MRTLRTGRGGMLLAVGLAAVLLLGAAPAAAQDTPTRRERMLALINRARTARDLPRLAFAPRLSRYAARHSEDMARRGSIYHSTNLAAVLAPFDWSIGGENVGAGFSVEGLHRAFMHSPPHRENVLRRSFRRVGIGFERRRGALWVTVVFYG